MNKQGHAIKAEMLDVSVSQPLWQMYLVSFHNRAEMFGERCQKMIIFFDLKFKFNCHKTLWFYHYQISCVILTANKMTPLNILNPKYQFAINRTIFLKIRLIA